MQFNGHPLNYYNGTSSLGSALSVGGYNLNCWINYCPPTPPLTHHFALSEKQVLMLGRGRWAVSQKSNLIRTFLVLLTGTDEEQGWCTRFPPCNVARVRIQASMSYLGWERSFQINNCFNNLQNCNLTSP